MMRMLALLACLASMQVVLPSAALAQPAVADAATQLVPVLLANDFQVRARAKAAGLAPQTVRAWLVVADDGRVASARLEGSTGDRHVDAALVDWLEESGFTESRPREGWLDVWIDAEGVPTVVQAPPAAGQPQVVHTPGMWRVQRAMNLSNLTTLALTLELVWDADGRVVSARVLEPSPAPAVDKALVDWGRDVRFAPGAPGSGRIPVQLKSESWY
jgi:TonB family protein